MKDKMRAAVLRHTLFSEKDAVVAAVSGGADSMALLHLLCTAWQLDVTVVHINHGIRGAEAQRDAEFVRAACERYGVPFVLHSVDVPHMAAVQKRGLEECARAVRYAFLQQEAESRNAVIATAHTRTDQTETILLNLTRGTGSRGLCGMPYKRGRIVRPLLDCTREEVEYYCAEQGIHYVTDSTNADVHYARNRIRTAVLPQLRQLNPQLERAVYRMAEQLRAQDAYITQQANELLAVAQTASGWNAADLRNAPQALQTKALLLICDRYGTGKDTAEHHISALQALLQTEGAVNLPGRFRAVCRADVLQIEPPCPQSVPAEMPTYTFSQLPQTIEWCGRTFRISCRQPSEKEKPQKVYKMSLSVAPNCDTISKPERFVWRGRHAGDRFQPLGRNTKTLKKLFNEANIPIEQRSRLAVLEFDGKIIWVEGFGVSEHVRFQSGCAELWITEEDTNAQSNECGY